MLYLLATLQSYVVNTQDRARRDETGATAVEYGLLVGLIAVAIIVSVTALGTQLGTLFTGVKGKIPTV